MLLYMFNLLLCILVVQVVWIRFVQQLNLDGDSVNVTRHWQLKHAWSPWIIAFDNRGNQIYLYRMHILLHSLIALDNRL